MGALVQHPQSLGRSHAVGNGSSGRIAGQFQDRRQANLEKLVHVAGGDAQELQAFQERDRRTLGQRQDTLVEFQQTGLSIEKARLQCRVTHPDRLR